MIVHFDVYPEFTTARLWLRALTKSDAPAIFDLRNNEVVNAYLHRPSTASLEEVNAFIEKINNIIVENEGLYWLLIERKTNVCIGTACVFAYNVDKKTVEIGYELLPEFHGKGLMGEAIEAVISFVFKEMKAQTILAFTHSENSKSIGLLKKLDFIFDAFDQFPIEEEDPQLKCYFLTSNLKEVI